MKMAMVLSFFCALLLLNFSAAEDKHTEVKIQKIAEGVCQHFFYEKINGWGAVAYNGLIAVEEKNAYIIDTHSFEKNTQALVQWISAQGFTTKASISAHFHTDTTAGIAYLNSRSIPTYASKLTNQLLSKKCKAQATLSFSKKNPYLLLKNKIQEFLLGAGHSPDNLATRTENSIWWLLCKDPRPWQFG